MGGEIRYSRGATSPFASFPHDKRVQVSRPGASGVTSFWWGGGRREGRS